MISGKDTAQDFVLDNIGPVERLELHAKPGTITVFRGPNGAGKSTALHAVQTLAGKPGGRLSTTDGKVGGKAEGFGCTIKIGRGGANRRMGDLEIDNIEAKFGIAELVEPNLKDPAAADAMRLRALVSLSGVTVGIEQYHLLVGGADEFNRLVPPEQIDSIDDPVKVADRIKRALEAEARTQEQRAERKWTECKARRDANEGLDLEAPSDERQLQQQLEAALQQQSAIVERHRVVAERLEAAADARRQLDAMINAGSMSIEAAKENLATTQLSRGTAFDAVQECKRKLAEAEANLRVADERVKTAEQQLAAIEKQEQLLAGWRRTIEASEGLEPVTQDAIAEADEYVVACRAAYDQGLRVRDGLKREAEAGELESQAAECRKRAESLREAAKSTQDVLARSVGGLSDVLSVDGEFRLIAQHPKRGECYFAELSHGERWSIALNIAIRVFGERGEAGVLVIPQEAWEGLDGRNRRLIADRIAGTGLYVFTAEATREEDATADVEVETLEAVHE